jgi:hypothetical protein
VPAPRARRRSPTTTIEPRPPALDASIDGGTGRASVGTTAPSPSPADPRAGRPASPGAGAPSLPVRGRRRSSRALAPGSGRPASLMRSGSSPGL